MTALILRRLLLLPVLLFVIYTVTFALAWLIPGNPLEQDGRRPPPEVAEAMLAQYNLNSPWAFYWDYLGKATGVSWLAGKAGLGAGHARPFDLGPSLQHQDWTVNEILAGTLPVSITLGLAAILLACVIGVTAGVIGAVRPGSWSDTVTLGVALIGISLPAFVTGTVLLIVFAFMLGWFPVAGWGTPGHLVLPAITLALPPAAYIARLTRFGMIEQLRQDYIRTARAKGAPEHRVVLHHALKNALLPVLSYLGPAAAAAMTGSFVVEKVFAVPGVGTHFVDAVLGKDLTMIMGVVIVYATMLILFNLVVDVLYAWIDPRIRVT
ncbi:MAG: ABC transporter permease [Phycisphaeraceae bacterium]|nr:MAG: ABC transporter permease [Phycisphaeraceae bacterium]